MKRKKNPNTWMHIIVGGGYAALIIVFGVQTWLLVDWLYPTENTFMKVGTVCAFDVASVMWAAIGLFYVFHKRKSKEIAQGMWVVTFILATIASGIQMYLSSTTRLNFRVDPQIISIAYILTIIALTANLIALTFFIKMEWEAAHPNNVLEEEEEEHTPTFLPIRRTDVLGDDTLHNTNNHHVQVTPVGEEEKDF